MCIYIYFFFLCRHRVASDSTSAHGFHGSSRLSVKPSHRPKGRCAGLSPTRTGTGDEFLRVFEWIVVEIYLIINDIYIYI